MLKLVSWSKFSCPSWSGVEQVWAICGYRYEDYVAIKELVEIDNSSTLPEDTFVVTGEDLIISLRHVDKTLSLLGFAHTHPDDCPIPSNDDLEGIGKGFFGIIFCNNRVIWYDEKGSFTPKFLSSVRELGL